MRKIDKLYGDLLSYFEEGLHDWLSSFHAESPSLFEAMKYSMEAGGKRIRPVLLLAANEMLGGEREEALPFAIAVEMIHTYSLIHDDLPAMDNDDFRRGKPSNHKKFGEGLAILAGDGLLSLAFELCLDSVNGENSLKAARILAHAAGVNGMVAGQAADLESERGETVSESALSFIIENKTAKMICAPLEAAAALNGGKYFSELSAYGEALGRMFQVTDDILDVEGEFENMGKTLGKDQKEEKLTSVKFYGLNGAKELADRLYAESVRALENVPHADFLRGIAEKMRKRTG